MPRNTLARRNFFAGPGRFARTSVEGGGGGNPPADEQQQGNPPAGQQQQGQQSPPANSGPPEAVDNDGNKLGFPANTAVSEMKPEQQASYWRNESKKQQKAREDAERKLAQNGNGSGTVPGQQQETNEQAVAAAREEGRREAAKDAALASLRASFSLRGKEGDELDDLVGVVAPEKFLTDDGKVDGTKIATYVARLAPAQGGNEGPGGSPGQGRREQGPADKKAAGKAESERRFGNQQQSAQRGTLGGLRRG